MGQILFCKQWVYNPFNKMEKKWQKYMNLIKCTYIDLTNNYIKKLHGVPGIIKKHYLFML